jgi:hypothetical protein
MADMGSPQQELPPQEQQLVQEQPQEQAPQAQPAVSGETTVGAGGAEMPLPVVRPVRVIGKSEQPTAPQIPNVGIGSQEIDIINRGLVAAQERINKQERQETAIRSYLGERYDPYGALDADPMVQMDMGRSESFANMQEKFQRAYPDGNFMSFPTSDGPVFIARKGPNDPYQKIGVVWEGIGNIATFRTLGSTVGGVVGGATRLPGASPALTAVGSLVGSELDRYIEGQKNLPEQEGGILSSLGGAAFDAAMDAGTRAVFKIPYGPVQMSSYEQQAAKSAVAAVKELGMATPLGWGQVHPEGIINRIFRQGLAFGGPAQELITKQQRELLEKFSKMAADELPPDAPEIVRGIVARQSESLNATIAASSLAATRGASRADGGKAIQAATEAYEFGSKRLSDTLWSNARKIADEGRDPISFYIGDAREVVEAARNEVVAHGQIKTAQSTSPIIDQFGGAIVSPPQVKETLVTVSPEIRGELKALMEDISKVTDASPYLTKVDQDGSYSTAFDQIKALRTRAWSLKEETEDPNVRRWAGQLFYELSKSMDNPIGGSPQFLSAYKNASSFYRLREETLSASYVARALASDTPEQLMTKYINPNNSTPWGALYEISGEKNWDGFRAAVINNILDAPSGRAGLDMLQAWERRAPINLNKTANSPWGIFTPVEKRDIYNILEQRAKFEGSPWSNLILNELTNAEIAVKSVRGSTAGNIESALRIAGLDPAGTDTARLFRAGVYNDILSKSSITSEKSQFPIIDAAKLRKEITYWQGREGIDRVFSPADWRKLENFREVGAAISAGDAGMSGELAAGAAAQSVAHGIISPVKGFVNGVVPYATNRTIGYFLAMPASTPRFDISQTGRSTLTALADSMLITNNQLNEKYSRSESRMCLGNSNPGPRCRLCGPLG